MTKLTKYSLGAIAAGVLALSLIFPYYYFHWGIKPCQGLPSDPSNCGDGDFGGVYFVLIAAPLLLLGVIGLVTAGVRRYIKKQ